MSKSLQQLSTDVTGGWVEISEGIKRLSEQPNTVDGMASWHRLLGELIPKVNGWARDLEELHSQIGRRLQQGRER